MDLWFLIEEADGSTWVAHDFGLFCVGHTDNFKAMVRSGGKRVVAIARRRKVA